MPIPEVKPTLSLRDLLPILVFSRARLAADPNTATLVAPFDDLRTQWVVVNQKEIDLEAAVANCESKATACDEDLDDFVKRFVPKLLRAAKDDRQSPLFKMFFGTLTPSLLARPILGKQLASMANWVAPLKASSDPDLADLGTELEPLVANAKTAEGALAAAQTALDTFAVSGDRFTFINKVNAVRNTTLGALSDIAYSRADLRLPADYPERFFPHAPRARAKVKSVDQLSTAVAKAQAQVDDLKQQLADAKAAEAAAEQAEADAQADQAQVDAAQKVVDQAQAALKAAQSQLAGLKKQPASAQASSSTTPAAPSTSTTASTQPTQKP